MTLAVRIEAGRVVIGRDVDAALALSDGTVALQVIVCVGVAVYSVMPVLWLVLSCAATAFACLVGMLFLITWLSTMVDVSILPRWLLYVASFAAPLLFWIVINLFS